ncbi:hypothetical protein vBBak6_106 [Bacillus phage v_B-Bak6]|uniref:Uncharacterized protein n=1 Tax=Bacillus phage Basilisk TaxID=1296654 RepID=S5M875_9CAUD|nr:hypothetical protein PP653_gp050 [Bacillus phage Basilisk]AGR46653.1 hypothetical protein BASILISK_117 [Bacillus phage Basilisk]AXY83066.1 hypothetical protein vBBak1_106 [Bacillus phage v_B-Bak1]AXY83186.1 hypothetical protein vBBak6_106 [Bacillus phage v_B-Bak6]
MTKTDTLEMVYENETIRAINEGGRYFFCAADIKRVVGYEKNQYEDAKPKDKIKRQTYRINGDGTKGFLSPQVFLTIQGLTDWLKWYHFEDKQKLFDFLIFESTKEDYVVKSEIKYDEKEVDKFESVFRNADRVNDLTNRIAKLKKMLDQEMTKPTKEQMKAYLQGMGL